MQRCINAKLNVAKKNKELELQFIYFKIMAEQPNSCQVARLYRISRWKHLKAEVMKTGTYTNSIQKLMTTHSNTDWLCQFHALSLFNKILKFMSSSSWCEQIT
jgi:hypothetical protein